MTWWEISQNCGGIEVTRHAGEWKFIPNRNPGRPKRALVMDAKREVEVRGNPFDLMRAAGIDVQQLTLDGVPVYEVPV